MFNDPCFTVYLKSNTIHVFKSAIRSIGNPNYVRLFIHEDGKTILMKSYDKKSQISIKVPRNLSDEKNNMRIHSKSFCYALAKSQGWDWQYSYRVPGIANKEQGIVIFDLTKAEIISESFTNRNS